MSHPLVIVEHAVRYFMSQWLDGLQPSLNINTHMNGEIHLRSEVNCAGVKSQLRAYLSKRKSGQYSRQRRRSRRIKTADQSVVKPASGQLEVTPLIIQETVEDDTLSDVGQIMMHGRSLIHEDTHHPSQLTLTLDTEPANPDFVKPELTVCAGGYILAAF